MEASRTHHVNHGQSLWSWVLIGAVGLTVAVAIALAMQTDTGGGNVTVRAPAEAQVQPQAQAEPSFRDDVLHGRGLVDVKIGAATFAAMETPDSFMQVREGYDVQEATVTPRRGPCATKAGC